MKVVVAVGSNIEPERNLPAALARLARRCRVLAVSPVFETAPVGAPGAPRFLNAAVLLDCEQSPEDLRDRILRPIEAELGRRRGEDRNAPRTIDLDIVLHGERLADPDLARHAHVATPAAAVAPELIHPELGRPLAAIAAELGSPGDEVELAGWSRDAPPPDEER